MTSERGSVATGRSQMNYGLSMVDDPVPRCHSHVIETIGKNRHENCPHHRLLFRLWPRNCPSLPCAGLEGYRHHAHTARRCAAALGAAPRTAARCDEACEHRGAARGNRPHRRAGQQCRHRPVRCLRGDADGDRARDLRNQHLRHDGNDASGVAAVPCATFRRGGERHVERGPRADAAGCGLHREQDSHRGIYRIAGA